MKEAALTCPALSAPHFDPGRNAWILSRYSDVQAAFHDANLWPVAPDGTGIPDEEARIEQARIRMRAFAAFPQAKLARWEPEFEAFAKKLTTAQPPGHIVDAASEFAFPWALEVALRVTGANPSQKQSLALLAAAVTAGTASPDDAVLKKSAAEANQQLDEALSACAPPMAGATFVALSQTLPCVLANGWFLLLSHPQSLEQLRTDSKLLPRAVEELLRLAGLPSVLHRRAMATVEIGDVLIERGDRVDLIVDAANHDLSSFPSGENFDLDAADSRPAHFALGAGQHSCAAGSLLRMTIGVATKAFLESFEPPEKPSAPVEWRGGSAFRWRSAVFALRRST